MSGLQVCIGLKGLVFGAVLREASMPRGTGTSIRTNHIELCSMYVLWSFTFQFSDTLTRGIAARISREEIQLLSSRCNTAEHWNHHNRGGDKRVSKPYSHS